MPTTDMQVTSIRLERELKERLKTLAVSQGYQTLIRDVLWTYVQQKSAEYCDRLSTTQISASVVAVAHHQQYCAVTGQVIEPQESMRLGFTTEGVLVPLSADGCLHEAQ
jgi:metal-responsive CopG/Arc/MetJ family transcriptional regulator